MNYYDAIAPGYNRLHASEQIRKLDSIATCIQPRGTLLDVGCGTGISTDYFAEHCDTTGIDPSGELIAQNNASKSTFIVGVAEQLPFDDGEFDVVLSLTAIQNFTDIAQGLREIRRVGKRTFILSWLKKSPQHDHIQQTIITMFGTPTHCIDDMHDTIYVYA